MTNALDRIPSKEQFMAAFDNAMELLKASMTPKQYAEAIDRLGLSQRSAGAFLGIDERQSRRWIAGDARIPESVAKLLRLMIAKDISPDDVK